MAKGNERDPDIVALENKVQTLSHALTSVQHHINQVEDRLRYVIDKTDDVMRRMVASSPNTPPHVVHGHNMGMHFEENVKEKLQTIDERLDVLEDVVETFDV